MKKYILFFVFTMMLIFCFLLKSNLLENTTDDVFNEFSKGKSSKGIDFEAATKMLPYPPSGLSARALLFIVRLEWKPSNLEIITHYNVYRRKNSWWYKKLKEWMAGIDFLENTFFFKKIGVAQKGLFVDKNTRNKTYIYGVTAVDIYGNESEMSETVIITGVN